MTNYKLVGNAKGESLVVVYENDDPVTVPDTHPRFNDILELLRSGNATDEAVETMVNTLLVAGRKLSTITDRVSVAPYGVFFDGVPLRTELADVLLEMVKNNQLDRLNSVAKFLENAAANQTMEGIDALYRWIQNRDLVITPEGNFLGYKAITRNSEGKPVSITAGKALVNGEVFEGQIPNNVGDTVSMPRDEVTDRTSVNCGPGLHAGTYAYAQWFKNLGGWGNRDDRFIILVEMNPRDVVSVPSDHNCAKLRVSKYKVLEEIEERLAVPFYDYNIDEDPEDDGDFYDEDDLNDGFEDGWDDWDEEDDSELSLKDELETKLAEIPVTPPTPSEDSTADADKVEQPKEESITAKVKKWWKG